MYLLGRPQPVATEQGIADGAGMRVVAIIQARLGSTRLPGKVLADLCGKPMLTHIVERVRRATKLDAVVVAYPLKDHDAMLAAINQRTDDGNPAGVGIYASQDDENDLVARYLSAAQAHHADIIVRICADNPCIDPAYLDHAVEEYMETCMPFVTNTTAACCGMLVDGVGAEVFSLSRLKWLDRKTQCKQVWREHPHKYFYDYNHLWPPANWHHDNTGIIRLDVNTQADLDFIRDIYEHVYPAHPQFTVEDVLAYLQVKRVL